MATSIEQQKYDVPLPRRYRRLYQPLPDEASTEEAKASEGVLRVLSVLGWFNNGSLIVSLVHSGRRTTFLGSYAAGYASCRCGAGVQAVLLSKAKFIQGLTPAEVQQKLVVRPWELNGT